MEFSGDFEVHITVQCSNIAELQSWCAERDLKCLHIMLSRGTSISQPMVSRRAHGTLSDQLHEARRLAIDLQDCGFEVTRVKVEAGIHNADIPLAADASSASSERYFEHHVKLKTPTGAPLDDLARTAERHGAHLSCNALRRCDNSMEERFVTQRCRNVGRENAESQLQQLLADLRLYPLSIVEVEREYVVVDSNESVDDGWLTGDYL